MMNFDTGLGRRRHDRLLRWALLLIGLISLTGCRGCSLPSFRRDESSKTDRSKKPPPPVRLELTSLQALPAASDGEGLTMKPGHWYEMQQSARANDADEALSVTCSATESAFPFRPIPVLSLRETITFERRVSLARGQRKQLALEMFFPDRRFDKVEENRRSAPPIILARSVPHFAKRPIR